VEAQQEVAQVEHPATQVEVVVVVVILLLFFVVLIRFKRR
jgi:hypothetical protein